MGLKSLQFTPAGDIYAFGILANEVLTLKEVSYTLHPSYLFLSHAFVFSSIIMTALDK